MEFLSPEEKRAKTKKLFFGYGLALVVVVSTTVVLSFVLQGVDLFSRQIDSKNGLLFVDSKPVSANIFIDNVYSKRTDARFVLPEGKYNLKLTEEGYRDWEKQVDVIGGQVRYHVYPKLFPTDIKTTDKAALTSLPSIYTQTPDRKFLILSPTKEQAVLHKYDLGKQDSPPTQLVLPESVVTLDELNTAVFEQVEWTSDGKYVLYKKILPGSLHYILINIDQPEQSIDLSTRLNLTGTVKLTLRDQKYDKYYVVDSNRILRAATLSGGIEPKLLAESVVDYKYYADNIILYASTAGAKEDELSIRVIRNSETFLLEPIIRSDKVLLDVAAYENDWYYVAGSNAASDVKVFYNPLDQTPNIVDGGVIKAQIKLNINNPEYVSFSDNARFMAAQSKDFFAVYDAELNKKYRYNSPVDLPERAAKWMDGHRYAVISNGVVQVFEFDGKNLQALTSATAGFNTYFDRDYYYMYNITTKADGKFVIQQSNLRVNN